MLMPVRIFAIESGFWAHLTYGQHLCRYTLLCRMAFLCAFIHVSAAGQTSLIVTPQELSFAIPAGAGTSATQSLSVASSGPSLPFVAAARYLGLQDAWLSISPAAGATPANLTITANASRLTAGTYLGQVTITAGGIGKVVNVILAVGASGSTGGTLIVSPSSLTFVGQPGILTLPSQNISVSNDSRVSGPVSFRAIASSSGWLSVPSGSGVTPATIGVEAFPAGLPAGILTGSVSLIPSAGGTPTIVPVTLISAGTTAAPPAIQLSQTALTITYQTGGSSPPVQDVSVSATTGFREYTASTTTAWMRLISTFNPVPATTVTDFAPGQFSVVTDPTGLVPGTYVGTVDVTSSEVSPLQLPVSLIVSSTPALSAQPSSIILDQNGGYRNSLSITSTGGALSFNATATSATGWLSVSPAAGSTANGPQSLTISANTTGLAAGVYTGSVAVTSPGSPTLTIPVRITVTAGSTLGTLTLASDSVTLNALVGGSNPFENVQINTESGTAHNFTAATSSTGGWLQVEPFAGTAPGFLKITANLALAPGPGSHMGSVVVTSLVTGQQYTIAVTLQLAEEAIAADPTSLTFVQTQPGTAPPSQTLQITANVLSRFRIEAPSWIRLSSNMGSTPATITVWPELALLPPGTNSDTIRIIGPKNAVRVPVTLTLAALPALTSAPESVAFTYALGGPVAPMQTVQIDNSAGPTPFSVTTTIGSGERWLSVTPGSGRTPAALTVSVDPALAVPGRHSATITVTATDASAQPRMIPVTLTVNPPVAAIESVLHGATFVPTAVAPGQVVTIRGVGMGPDPGVTGRPTAAGAFDTRLAETRVLFDSVPAALLYVRSDQINAVVPYSLSGRVSTRIHVEQGANWSLPVELKVVDAIPGIFTTTGTGRGQAAALNSDFTPNSLSNPAQRGSVISVFGTGEGQTEPAGQDGRVIATDLRRPILPVTARIGGRPAQVLYAGSAAQLVSGVFQVNLRIPEDVEPGTVALEVQAGSAVSQPGVSIVVR
jgi:uncharacterized protein (TIGR03437 family)